MEKLNGEVYIDTYELNVREEKINLKCYIRVEKMNCYSGIVPIFARCRLMVPAEHPNCFAICVIENPCS